MAALPAGVDADTLLTLFHAFGASSCSVDDSTGIGLVFFKDETAAAAAAAALDGCWFIGRSLHLRPSSASTRSLEVSTRRAGIVGAQPSSLHEDVARGTKRSCSEAFGALAVARAPVRAPSPPPANVASAEVRIGRAYSPPPGTARSVLGEVVSRNGVLASAAPRACDVRMNRRPNVELFVFYLCQARVLAAALACNDPRGRGRLRRWKGLARDRRDGVCVPVRRAGGGKRQRPVACHGGAVLDQFGARRSAGGDGCSARRPLLPVWSTVGGKGGAEGRRSARHTRSRHLHMEAPQRPCRVWHHRRRHRVRDHAPLLRRKPRARLATAGKRDRACSPRSAASSRAFSLTRRAALLVWQAQASRGALALSHLYTRLTPFERTTSSTGSGLAPNVYGSPIRSGRDGRRYLQPMARRAN